MHSDNSNSTGKLDINIVAREDGDLVCLDGRIDIDSSPDLRERLLALLRAPHPKIVSVDLSAVTYIDTSGVATLIDALKTARADKTEFRLQGLHDRILHLFEFRNLKSLFDGGGQTLPQSGCKAV